MQTDAGLVSGAQRFDHTEDGALHIVTRTMTMLPLTADGHSSTRQPTASRLLLIQAAFPRLISASSQSELTRARVRPWRLEGGTSMPETKAAWLWRKVPGFGPQRLSGPSTSPGS